MDVYVYLRRRIAFVRDGYTATMRERRKLYLWLKCNDSWRQPSMREKLGNRNYAWLEGLVAFGDEKNWMAQGMREAAKEVLG